MITTLERILVPIDLTDRSHAAIECAVALAQHFDAAVDILYVWRMSDYVPESLIAAASESAFDTYAAHEASLQLDTFLSSVPLENIQVQTCLACGDVSETILEFAASEHHDLIVVGNPVKNRWTKLLGGSVADSVMNKAPCPVLSVRPSTNERLEAHT